MPASNERLVYWFRQGGWTQRQLAREVSRLGQSLGHNMAPDSSRVRRWLEGEQPRQPVPELLCSLFATRIGYPFRPEDLGLEQNEKRRDDISWDHADLISTLQDFIRSDLMIGRRDLLHATTVVATGPFLETRISGWLENSWCQPHTEAQPGKIGYTEIQEIEAATRVFWDWDARRGGGLYREAVIGQLKAMTDMLKDTYSESITRRLFRSTADLARLAGWMSHDVGLETRAQQYFMFALHCRAASSSIRASSSLQQPSRVPVVQSR